MDDGLSCPFSWEAIDFLDFVLISCSFSSCCGSGRMVEQEDGTMYLTQWHSCGTGGSTKMRGKSSIGEPNARLEEDEMDTAKLIVPTRN